MADADHAFAPYYDVTMINAKCYGARGDGTTDDSGALQAAVDAAISSGGRAVYLPGGVYRVKKGIRAAGDVTLRGDNAYESILDGGSDADLTILTIECGSQRFASVQDLQFRGGGTQVYIPSADNILAAGSSFRRVIFYRYRRKGLHFANALALGCQHTDLRFAAGTPAAEDDGTGADSTKTFGIYAKGDAILNATRFSGMRFTDNTGAGIKIDCEIEDSNIGNANIGVELDHVYFEFNPGSGLHCRSSEVQLYNAYFEQNAIDDPQAADVLINSNWGGTSAIASHVHLYSPTFTQGSPAQFDGEGHVRVKLVNQFTHCKIMNATVAGSQRHYVDVANFGSGSASLHNSSMLLKSSPGSAVFSTERKTLGFTGMASVLCSGPAPRSLGVPAMAGNGGGAVLALCSVNLAPTGSISGLYLLNVGYLSTADFSATHIGGTNFVTFSVVDGKIAAKATDNTHALVSLIANRAL